MNWSRTSWKALLSGRANDLENIGDWEYKVIDLTDGCAAAMETTLNELGNDRWEVFWIENSKRIPNHA